MAGLHGADESGDMLVITRVRSGGGGGGGKERQWTSRDVRPHPKSKVLRFRQQAGISDGGGESKQQ